MNKVFRDLGLEFCLRAFHMYAISFLSDQVLNLASDYLNNCISVGLAVIRASSDEDACTRLSKGSSERATSLSRATSSSVRIVFISRLVIIAFLILWVVCFCLGKVINSQ